MLKKILIGTGVLVAIIVLGLAGLYMNAASKESAIYDAPYPPIVAATAPEAIARGEHIFMALCMDCHAGASGDRPIGVPMLDMPAFLGKAFPANLTLHPEYGIGKLTDAEIARTLRFGVRKDGKYSVMMSTFGKLGDSDIAAVLGFIRSGNPIFAPDPNQPPPSEWTPMGKMILAYTMGYDLDRPASGIIVPPKAPNAEYGRYMIEGVYGCLECHTQTFERGPAKALRPDVFGGGMELAGADGKQIFTTNISPDPTHGIGTWTREQFARAIREGVNPDGSILRYPMPKYRRLDDVEIDAIWAVLRSTPPVGMPNLAGGAPRPKLDPNADAAGMFTNLGCVTCHGEGAAFRDKIAAAKDKSLEEVAAWIRNPEKTKPGTKMPTYESLIDEQKALSMAAWVKTYAAGITVATK